MNLKKHIGRGSDHFFHLSLIKRIHEQKKIQLKNIFTYGEKYPVYPQLYHLLLSPFYNIIKDRPSVIILFSFLIERLMFLVYILTFYYLFEIHTNLLFLQLFLYFTFTGDLFSWNSKSRGLNTRGIGISLAYLYLFLIIFSVPFANVYLIILSVIIFLSSQFAFQFITFFNLLSLVLFKTYEPLMCEFVGLFLLICFWPSYTIAFIKGQINHKYNYFKYLSHVFLFKYRYSIWRDFFYDFFKQKTLKKTLIYFLSNPIIEVIISIPFLIISIYISTISSVDLIPSAFDNVILITFFIAFLTSFRYTRFLGEPQRYLDFILPISIIYSSVYLINSNFLLPIIVYILFFNALKLYINRKVNFKTKDTDIFLYFNENDHSNKLLLSDNSNLSKSLMAFGLQVLRFDLTKRMKSLDDFKKIHNNSYEFIEDDAFIDFKQNFNVDLILLSNSKVIPELVSEFNLVKTFKNYSLYEKRY